MESNNEFTVCVYGASSDRIHPDYSNAAHELGALMAQRGWSCVNGAGSHGLMRAVSDGVLEGGATVTGVIPKFMVDNGWAYDRLTSTIVTADMHQRKETMARLANAFVALPGGCGTLEELMEVFTWIQLGIIEAKPLVVLNTRGYYSHLIAQIELAAREGFMKLSHVQLWQVADTPLEAVEAIERARQRGSIAVESKY